VPKEVRNVETQPPAETKSALGSPWLDAFVAKRHQVHVRAIPEVTEHVASLCS
jgi:hypothetical protein